MCVLYVCACVCACTHAYECVVCVYVSVHVCSFVCMCMWVLCVLHVCASVGICLYVCWFLKRIFLSHSWNCVPSTGLWMYMTRLSFYLGAADLNSASNAETEPFFTP